MASSALGRFCSKYGAVIFFPTFAASTIYADWSHTRRWKREVREAHKAEHQKQEVA